MASYDPNQRYDIEFKSAEAAREANAHLHKWYKENQSKVPPEFLQEIKIEGHVRVHLPNNLELNRKAISVLEEILSGKSARSRKGNKKSKIHYKLVPR